MKLKKLYIKNLRNISEMSLQCSDGIHFIHGQNAQGKTTLLESIYLLSNLRTFRQADVAALIQIEKPIAQVRGMFEIDENTEAELKVELELNRQMLKPRLEKRAYINQKLSRSAAEYFGVKLIHSPIQFHAITLNPTSTDLIRGEPSLRRNYLNQVIASENPFFLNTLKRYQKVVDQKNALLKQEFGFDAQILTVLNESLVQEGAKVLHARLEYLEKMVPKTTHFLAQIAPDQNQSKIAYFLKNTERQTIYFTRHFELPTLNFCVELYHREIDQFSHLEKVRKSSLIGPHRDDLVFESLVETGSQGEVRSFLLALKLAELEQFQTQTGVQPVLLIDDFSSELDKKRRGFLLDYLNESKLQVFVTSTDDPENLNLSGNAKRNITRSLQVQQGSLIS